jgi:ketosteroid isomerase-like protein
LDAFNRRDRAAWLAVCDPELEDIPPRDWPESRRTLGSEAVWDLYVDNNEIWEGAQFQYFELSEAGNDKTVAKVQGDVRGMASGAGVAFSLWQVVSLRNGKLLRIEWFADRAEALEAAGLRE